MKEDDSPSPIKGKVAISSSRPSSSYTPSSAPKKPNAMVAKRSLSNYSPSHMIIPPPLDANIGVAKGIPANLPPPPTSLIPASPNSIKRRENSQPLPKFSESKETSNTPPIIPPRSPPRELTKSDLPAVPSRPTSEPKEKVENSETPSAMDGGQKKRTKDELRKECITEIFQTEKDYIYDLETMIHVRILTLSFHFVY